MWENSRKRLGEFNSLACSREDLSKQKTDSKSRKERCTYDFLMCQEAVLPSFFLTPDKGLNFLIYK